MDAGSIPAISTIKIKFKTIRRTIKKAFPKKQVPKNRVNEMIRVPEVRVIDDEGNQLGIMNTRDALAQAREEGLDLVEVSPKAQPPVCRIMDYGKHQYQQSKQDRLNKAKQKKFDIKGIRLGLKTDTHDLNFKKKQIEKFLAKGHKVKIEIILKGREKIQRDLARETLENFLGSLEIPFSKEQEIKKFPQGFNVIITN